VGLEEGIVAATANDDLTLVFDPLDRISWGDSEAPPDGGGHRDLALPGETGSGYFHAFTLPW
jgi:hypothetical protein